MRVKMRDAAAAEPLAQQARLAKIDEVIGQRPIGPSTHPDRKLKSREEACRGSNERPQGFWRVVNELPFVLVIIIVIMVIVRPF